jgi:hypothetical protein
MLQEILAQVRDFSCPFQSEITQVSKYEQHLIQHIAKEKKEEEEKKKQQPYIRTFQCFQSKWLQ